MKKLVATVLSLAAAVIAHGQTFTTVAPYDSVNHWNTVDVMNPTPAYYGGFVPSVSSAHAFNKGGVVNFDVTNSFPWNVAGVPLWNAKYGAALINNCLLSFGNPVRVGNMLTTPWTPISGSPNQPGAVTTVGATPMIFKIAPSALTSSGTMVPVPVRRAGITVLQRIGVPQKVLVNFYQGGGPTISTSFLIPAGVAGAVPNRDTFVGRDTTVAGGIVAMEIKSFHAVTGAALNVSCDDFAFVTF